MEWWAKMTFPEKLYRMASTNDTDCIQWHETGQSVIINVPKFEEKFLKSGLFFKTSKMNSMIRQLNYYGFKNKTIIANGHFIECTHPEFKRGYPPERIQSLRRRHNCKSAIKIEPETKDDYLYPEVKIKEEIIDYPILNSSCVSESKKTVAQVQKPTKKSENQEKFTGKYKAFVECMPVRGLRIDVMDSAQSKTTREIYGVEEQYLRNNYCYTTALSYLIASLQELKRYDVIDEIITIKRSNTSS